MAFDRPIEADRVDDLGLFSTFIRAPVVGTILWLLGADDAKQAEEAAKLKHEKEMLEKQLMEESDDEEDDGDDDEQCDEGNINDGTPPDSGENDTIALSRNSIGGQGHHEESNSSSSSAATQPYKKAEINGHNKENESSALEPWPQVGVIDSDDDDMDQNRRFPALSSIKNKNNIPATASTSSADGKKASLRPHASMLNSRRNANNDQSLEMERPATKIVDELVAVMEASSLSSPPTSGSSIDSPGPATSAVNLASSVASSTSTNSFSGSYSASTFSSHQTPLKLSRHSSFNNVPLHSQNNYAYTSHQSNPSIRSKKTSWSDECGQRSLVEYFDESNAKSRQGHWTTSRRNSWIPSRSSFDGVEKSTVGSSNARRGELRIIKSALRRSGSYSPPVPMYGHQYSNSTNSSSSTSSSYGSRSPGVKSFRSLSVIGSSCSSNSTNSSESQNSTTIESSDTLNGNSAMDVRVQCVPSTLQGGCGQASGGLIIPRGGPGMGGLAGYHLILGTGVTRVSGPAEGATATSGATPVINSRTKPKQFLPHHGNGYVSPQYGFYVNITPPTPEMHSSQHPNSGNTGDKTSQSAVPQPYQQFYHPSPIPEGRVHTAQPSDATPGPSHPTPKHWNKNNIKHCVGEARVGPSLTESNQVRDPKSAAMQRSLKPTFTKNKKGLGMVLAGNSHHVWPTVPFG